MVSAESIFLDNTKLLAARHKAEDNGSPAHLMPWCCRLARGRLHSRQEYPPPETDGYDIVDDQPLRVSQHSRVLSVQLGDDRNRRDLR